MHDIFFTSSGEKWPTLDKKIIYFSDVDLLKDILYPYDDSLIKSIPINQAPIKRTLVDTDS